MRTVGWIVMVLVAGALNGCGSKRAPDAPSAAPLAQTPSAPPALPPQAVAVDPMPSQEQLQRFGEPLQDAPALELGRLLAEPKSYAAQQVTVEGVVRQVCRARGCWLELATGSGDRAEGCRVVMKGHAFFVPTDSIGRRVRVQGEADVKVVPAAQVAHMEQEGGRFSNKQPDGSAHELRIVARGVELLPAAAARM